MFFIILIRGDLLTERNKGTTGQSPTVFAYFKGLLCIVLNIMLDFQNVQFFCTQVQIRDSKDKASGVLSSKLFIIHDHLIMF